MCPHSPPFLTLYIPAPPSMPPTPPTHLCPCTLTVLTLPWALLGLFPLLQLLLGSFLSRGSNSGPPGIVLSLLCPAHHSLLRTPPPAWTPAPSCWCLYPPGISTAPPKPTAQSLPLSLSGFCPWMSRPPLLGKPGCPVSHHQQVPGALPLTWPSLPGPLAGLPSRVDRGSFPSPTSSLTS